MVVLDVCVSECHVGEECPRCKSGERECTDERIRKKDEGLLVTNLVTALGVIYSYPVFVRKLVCVDVVAHVWIAILVELGFFAKAFSMNLAEFLFKQSFVPPKRLAPHHSNLDA